MSTIGTVTLIALGLNVLIGIRDGNVHSVLGWIAALAFAALHYMPR